MVTVLTLPRHPRQRAALICYTTPSRPVGKDELRPPRPDPADPRQGRRQTPLFPEAPSAASAANFLQGPAGRGPSLHSSTPALV